MRDRGIILDSTHSLVFVSILDLILLSLFDKYAVKQAIFLKADRLLSLHNPSISYPSLPEGYFASLPMTRMDETVLRALIQKKQPIDLSVEISSQREILLSIVKAITPKTASSNSASFSIDYCAYWKEGLSSVVCRCSSSCSRSGKSCRTRPVWPI